jgi:hypothetical protein
VGSQPLINNILVITNIGKIQAGWEFYITCRIYLNPAGTDIFTVTVKMFEKVTDVNSISDGTDSKKTFIKDPIVVVIKNTGV